MESTGSAVVDFGRFCTAFLVVMGVGMLLSSPSSIRCYVTITIPSGSVGEQCVIPVSFECLG